MRMRPAAGRAASRAEAGRERGHDLDVRPPAPGRGRAGRRQAGVDVDVDVGAGAKHGRGRAVDPGRVPDRVLRVVRVLVPAVLRPSPGRRVRQLPRQPGAGHRADRSHQPGESRAAAGSRHPRGRAEHPGNRPDHGGIRRHQRAGARGRPRPPARHAAARPGRRQRDFRSPHLVRRAVRSAMAAARGRLLHRHRRAGLLHLPGDRPAAPATRTRRRSRPARGG